MAEVDRGLINSTAICEGFAVDKVTQGQIFPIVLRFAIASSTSPVLCYNLRCIISEVDCVVAYKISLSLTILSHPRGTEVKQNLDHSSGCRSPDTSHARQANVFGDI